MPRHSSPFRLRAILDAALPVLLSLSWPFMIWNGLAILTASPYPVMCVISESMAPAFHRGDILILWNRSPVHAGDIPVVWFTGNPYPMVHRAVQVYEVDSEQEDNASLRQQLIVTKGDNNEVMDVPLYPPGKEFVSRDEVVGLVRGYVPLLGWMVIALQESIWIKYLAIGLVLCFSLFD